MSDHTSILAKPPGLYPSTRRRVGPNSALGEHWPEKSDPQPQHITERNASASASPSSQTCLSLRNDPAHTEGLASARLLGRPLVSALALPTSAPDPQQRLPAKTQQHNDGADFEHSQASRGGTATPERARQNSRSSPSGSRWFPPWPLSLRALSGTLPHPNQ